MPKRSRSLVDEEIAARKPRDERDDFATWRTGVDLVPCLFCDRDTDRPDSICSDHDLDPGGRLWGRALTSEQVREQNQRVRWNVR